MVADEILLVQHDPRCFLDTLCEVAGHESGKPTAARWVERLKVEQPAVVVTPRPARRGPHPKVIGLERAGGRVRIGGQIVMCHC